MFLYQHEKVKVFGIVTMRSTEHGKYENEAPQPFSKDRPKCQTSQAECQANYLA